MANRRTFMLWFLYTFQIFIISCKNPRNAIEDAIEQRTKEGFENFIAKYPESEYVPMAKKMIFEVRYWDSINKYIDTSLYHFYLDSFPKGLFEMEANNKITECREFYHALNEDDISHYHEYIGAHPKGIFTDSANRRILKLGDLEKSYLEVSKTPSIGSLKSFIENHEPSGYSKKAMNILDSIAEIQVDNEILKKDPSLPATHKELEVLINKTKEIKYVLVNEKYLYEKINITGTKLLPSIPGSAKLVFNGQPSMFSIKNAKDPKWDDHIIGFCETKQDVFFAEFIFGLSGERRSIFPLHGSSILTGLQWKHNSSKGSILRFYGILPNVHEMRIESFGDSPLTFYLDEKNGWVHLYGKGRVTLKNGNFINF